MIVPAALSRYRKFDASQDWRALYETTSRIKGRPHQQNSIKKSSVTASKTYLL